MIRRALRGDARRDLRRGGRWDRRRYLRGGHRGIGRWRLRGHVRRPVRRGSDRWGIVGGRRGVLGGRRDALSLVDHLRRAPGEQKVSTGLRLSAVTGGRIVVRVLGHRAAQLVSHREAGSVLEGEGDGPLLLLVGHVVGIRGIVRQAPVRRRTEYRLHSHRARIRHGFVSAQQFDLAVGSIGPELVGMGLRDVEEHPLLMAHSVSIVGVAALVFVVDCELEFRWGYLLVGSVFDDTEPKPPYSVFFGHGGVGLDIDSTELALLTVDDTLTPPLPHIFDEIIGSTGNFDSQIDHLVVDLSYI